MAPLAIAALVIAVSAAGNTGETAHANPLVGGSPSAIADVTEKALPSVVNISTRTVVSASTSPFHRDPFFSDPSRRRGQERHGQSLGSGVIVSRDGLVLTNNHVVANARDIRLSLADGRELEAEVVGADPKSDLAVLRIKGRVANLEPIRFGDSGALRLGDVVLAIGNPFGIGQTVTMGIVSAKGRANMGIVDYEDFIQTDAASNPGNSCGALINLRGELVGINTAILSRTGSYQGIGFAIPSNMARPIMRSLIDHGRVVRGWLGVEIQPVTPELAEALELGDSRGVVVSNVVQQSPAARAGLRRGDLVVAIDGKPVRQVPQARNTIAAAGANQEIRLDVVREGKRRTVRVKLEELPGEREQRVAQSGGDAPGGGQELGLVVRPVDAAARRQFKLPAAMDHGVVVTRVEQQGIAARLGLQPGDVILEVNRQRVKTPRDFNQAYAQTGSRVALLVYRDGSAVYLAFSK
jgi:serine protease Do